MLEVIENGCSKNYLDMLKFAVINSSEWNMKYPIGMDFDDKHLKLDIIENKPINEMLSGMAMGLLIQLYDKRSDLFYPDVSYCGISMKDKHRLDNPHVDHENDMDYIKILGLLNSDWGPMDGGLFLHGDEAIPMVPTNFVVFDPRVKHCASEITTDKKRLGIDFTVRKKG
jgi:hypothetical protein